MTPTHRQLADAILAEREDLVRSGRYASYREINAGHCADFCGDVAERLGLDPAGEEPFELGIDNLMLCEDGEPFVMDRELLARHWPAIRPPEGMDWDDLDAMASHGDFSCGTHVWLCMGGRHYDAEAPEGVDNVFDLPLFGRVAETYRASRAPAGP